MKALIFILSPLWAVTATFACALFALGGYIALAPAYHMLDKFLIFNMGMIFESTLLFALSLCAMFTLHMVSDSIKNM